MAENEYIKKASLCAWLEHMGVSEYIISAIKDERKFPAADVVEVKRGKWEVRGQDVFCTNCNRESGYNAFGASAFSDYCPHCGADMRERKEDE